MYVHITPHRQLKKQSQIGKNIMLENEATSKVCPFMTATVNQQLSYSVDPHVMYNNPGTFPFTNFVYCMGAGCMAWSKTGKDEGVCLRLILEH